MSPIERTVVATAAKVLGGLEPESGLTGALLAANSEMFADEKVIVGETSGGERNHRWPRSTLVLTF